MDNMPAPPGLPGGTHWRNRIVKYELVDPEQLLANPFNFRIHQQLQQAHVEELLDRIGWVDVVKVNVNTQHVVDGHLRVTLALRHEEPTVPVLWVDLTEAEERAVLATLDWMTGEAGIDTSILSDLVADIGKDELFELDDGLFASLTAAMGLDEGVDYSELWQGMPEFEQEGLKAAGTVKVHFQTDGDRVAFSELVGQDITEKTTFIWFPKLEHKDLTKCMCKDES